MRKVVLSLICLFALSALSAQEPIKFSIDGKIDGAQRGDTLRFESVSPDWSQRTPAFDVVLGRSGRVKYKGTHAHTQNYSYYYHPVDTTFKVVSGYRAGTIFITQGKVKIEAERDNIYTPTLKGGAYDEDLQILLSKDQAIDKERDIILKRLETIDRETDPELYRKCEDEFNLFYSQKQIAERRDEVDSLRKAYNNSHLNEYAVHETLTYASITPLDTLASYYNRLSQRVKDSFYGVELNNRITHLKALAPQMPAPDFALTTISGEKITNKDLFGKYLLIYHYGMCPGSLGLDKQLSDWYKEHKDAIEVIGYTSSRESVAALSKEVAPGTKAMGLNLYEALQSMTSHPWKYEVDAATAQNKDLQKIYDFRGLPFFIFISPEGIILDRGFATFYNGALNVVGEE